MISSETKKVQIRVEREQIKLNLSVEDLLSLVVGEKADTEEESKE